MTASVTVRHDFEAAHRLPQLAGKCTSLHGHSWRCELTVTGVVADEGTVVEFGAIKAALRTWIDTHLDHGSMLAASDPLVPALVAADCKVYRFGSGLAHDLRWPTVENVAALLGRIPLPLTAGVYVSRVRIQETHLNAAEWSP